MHCPLQEAADHSSCLKCRVKATERGPPAGRLAPHERHLFLALSFLRLAWRLTHRPPAAAAMPAWQARVAHATHCLLYALFFAVPLIGWAYSSASGFPVVWFGVWQLPDFVPMSRQLAEAIKPWHERTAMLMAALVLLHLAGALKHHFIDRDGLIDRMRPARH